jgi:arylamine N-acetyltransferase
MRLDQYFARIGYDGPARVDPITLFRIHRAHALFIPFENFGVQLNEGVAWTKTTRFEIRAADAALAHQLAEIQKDFPQSQLGVCAN